MARLPANLLTEDCPILRLLPILFAGGCALSLPDPVLDRVEPAVGFVGEPVEVVIHGGQFYPAVGVDATGADPDVDGAFSVELFLPEDEGGPVRIPLPGAVLQSYERLAAVVPAGIEPHTYDVIVTGPTGGTGRLVNGYTGSATQADHLALDSDLIVYEVFEEAQFSITLRNRDGNRVLADEEVVVYVDAEDGEAAPSFAAGSLLDQQPLGPTAIQGRLGPDGAATFGLSSSTPDQLTVTVTPASSSSPLGDGSLVVLFEPGTEVSARLELPSESFRATAGNPFPLEIVLVDQFGNEAPDAAAELFLRSRCSSWVMDEVDVIGRTTVSPTLTQATDGTCSERIEAVGGASGSSATFEVDPGPAARFDVLATPAVLLAGETSLQAVATPADAFGNETTWTGTPVLRDSVDGLGNFDCSVDPQVVLCTAQPQIAGEDIVLTVDGQDGVSGSSDPYTVLAGSPTSLEVKIVDAPVVADVPAVVEITVLDAFGNLVDGDLFAEEAFSVFADGQRLTCTELVSPTERVLYSCPVRDADPSVEFRVELAGYGLGATASPVAVINGALADIGVTLSASTVAAGEDLGIDLIARDAWGNAYLVQDDPDVLVADTLGGVGPVLATLDVAGAASLIVQPTVAGTTAIEASQDGEVLGAAPLTVSPGPAESLSILVAEPWAWVGVPLDVTVHVVDAFGNTAAGDGIASLDSATGSAGQVSFPITGGVGSGQMTWSASQLDEQLDASGLGLVGSLGSLLVAEDCGGSGPTAVLAVPARSCAVDGAGSVTGDLDGSAAGASPIARVGLASANDRAIDAGGPLTVDLLGHGPHQLRGLVAASDGCGHEVDATSWLGPDDGSVVGPVALAVAAEPLSAGADSASLAVSQALACDGAPAVGAALRLRTDRGELLGVNPLGTGLYATVDAAGEATATLDATTALDGPDLAIRASSPSGAAAGTLLVAVDGDLVPPVVVAASPAGATSGTIDSAVLRFSEALDASSVAPPAFSLTGPTSGNVQFADLLADLRTIELRFQTPVDAGAGLWTLEVAPSITDLAGNALDGLHDGGAQPFAVHFGASTPTVSPVSDCGADLLRFRPDGDDGAGEESDVVLFSPVSASPPDSWVLSVYDASARLVRREPWPGTDAVLAWDGRDASGRVVEDGAWTVAIDARDDEDNLGGACTVLLTVDNGDQP